MTKDMTQGSPLKLILAFAVPLMLGSLFQQFYNLADTIIVGQISISCWRSDSFLSSSLCCFHQIETVKGINHHQGKDHILG